MSVLVACPVAEKKDYVLLDYLHAYKNFQTVEDIDLFMVDTTNKDDEERYADKVRGLGVRCVHLKPPFQGWCLIYTVSAAWEVILAEAWRRNVDWVFSIEVDVICPPETIEVFLALADKFGASLISHAYDYPDKSHGLNGLGCTMLDPHLFEPGEKLWAQSGHIFEEYMFEKTLRSGHSVLCTSGYLDIKHLHSIPAPCHPRRARNA
jgi:hypothetical protein